MNDVAHRLLYLFCGNLGQLVSLHAKLHGVKKVIFGDLLCNCFYLKYNLNKAVKHWSDNDLLPIFLRHDDFSIGTGSFVQAELSVLQKSWIENYSLSTGMDPQFCTLKEFHVKQLTLDSLEKKMSVCPLLECPEDYFPDVQNLSIDDSARKYWIECIKEGVRQTVNRITLSMSNPVPIKRFEEFRDCVVNKLDFLREHSQCYGNLSMRVLQDTMEQVKKEKGLIAMFDQRKIMENYVAVRNFESRLLYLDALEESDRQKEIILSIVAGNMFDWGAKEFSRLMANQVFHFSHAMEKVPGRPWLIDNVDQWLKRMKGSGHKLAMIFVDNSGYDIVFGILPFVRELLKRGTEVVLCANSEPVINDVTDYDLKTLLEECKKICPILGRAYEQEKLSVMSLARSSCCLDLRLLDEDICKKMTEVDLLVIEGMGRAVHTNLSANFTVENLRIGIIKDKWMSRQLGGDNFAVICKHVMPDKINF